MDVNVQQPDAVELVIKGTRAELASLYLATRRGRKSRAQQLQLEQFGDLLAAEPVLGRMVRARLGESPEASDGE